MSSILSEAFTSCVVVLPDEDLKKSRLPLQRIGTKRGWFLLNFILSVAGISNLLIHL